MPTTPRHIDQQPSGCPNIRDAKPCCYGRVLDTACLFSRSLITREQRLLAVN